MDKKIFSICTSTIFTVSIVFAIFYFYDAIVVKLSSYINLYSYRLLISIALAILIYNFIFPFIETILIILYADLALTLYDKSSFNVLNINKMLATVQSSKIIYDDIIKNLEIRYGFLTKFIHFFENTYILFVLCRSCVIKEEINQYSVTQAIAEYYSNTNKIRSKLDSISFFGIFLSLIVSTILIILLIQQKFWNILYLPHLILILTFMFILVNIIFLLINFSKICDCTFIEVDIEEIRSAVPSINILKSVDSKNEESTDEVK